MPANLLQKQGQGAGAGGCIAAAMPPGRLARRPPAGYEAA